MDEARSIGAWSSLKKEPEPSDNMSSSHLELEEGGIASMAAASEHLRLMIADRIKESPGQRRDRMGAMATYFAIIKGYCTNSMNTLPIGFKYGGWLFSPAILLVAWSVETFSAVRLS